MLNYSRRQLKDSLGLFSDDEFGTDVVIFGNTILMVFGVAELLTKNDKLTVAPIQRVVVKNSQNVLNTQK